MHAKSYRLLINYMIQFGLVDTLKVLYVQKLAPSPAPSKGAM